MSLTLDLSWDSPGTNKGSSKGSQRYPILLLPYERKGVNFVWSVKCQERFENLKGLLTMDPILKVDESYKDYTICTDSRKEGWGWGVLSQEGHVVCYKSCKLKDHERNYVVDDLELVAVVHDSKM